MIINAHLGEVVHVLKGGARRRFRPEGHLYVIRDDGARVGPQERASGHAKEDVTRYGSGSLSARLFVGLNVGDKPTFTVDDVVAAVLEERRKQGASPDASFLAQRGVYTSQQDGSTVVENSVQIVILHLSDAPREMFIEEMKKLGEALRTRLQQETIILEIQERGVVQDVFGIHA